MPKNCATCDWPVLVDDNKFYCQFTGKYVHCYANEGVNCRYWNVRPELEGMSDEDLQMYGLSEKKEV